MNAPHHGCPVLCRALDGSLVSAGDERERAARHLIAHDAAHEGLPLDLVALAADELLYCGAVGIAEESHAVLSCACYVEVVNDVSCSVEGAAVACALRVADGREVVTRHVQVSSQNGIGARCSVVHEVGEVEQVLRR